MGEQRDPTRRDGITTVELPGPASSAGLAGEAMRRRISSRLFGEEAEVVRIGRFRVLDIIGAGGMGIVYSAYSAARGIPRRSWMV